MSKRKTKVLYIEDDKNQRQLMIEQLQQRGYKISTSTSGSAGIKKVSSLKPDVILCDLNLPDLSGIQVLNQVKKSNPDVPVIILTAYGSIPLAVRAIREGAYEFIIKPFQIDEIETTIQKAMETKLLQQELRQSEANLQMLMENVPDVIYSLNPKGEFISLSPAVKTILDYEPAELIGTSVFKIIHKDDRERVREGFIKAVQSGQEQVRTVEFRMKTKSGDVKYFEGKGRYLVKDGRVYKSDGIAV
jgi:PAS domain S-box-containing protein